VRDGVPQTLTKLFVFGSDPVTIDYLLTSILFVKIIGCTCVHPTRTPMSYVGSASAMYLPAKLRFFFFAKIIRPLDPLTTGLSVLWAVDVGE
jgi:hypothetical protein